MDSERHPLLDVLDNALAGRYPAADGRVTVLPMGPPAAVVGFTMHHFVLTDVAEAEVRDQLDPDNFAAAMLPPFVSWLASRQGMVAGFSDIVLGRYATGGGADLLKAGHPQEHVAHPRVDRARHYRNDVEVWTDSGRGGVAIFGAGVAGRVELSVEIDAAHRGRGHSVFLIEEALRTRVAGSPVYAQVSPGNVASLRAFLNAGFSPVCAEVVFAAPGGATVSV